jgi:shikimate dehydrogenase
MKRYGLIGKPLTHSFSKRYFTEKFEREHIDSQYELFELADIQEFPALLSQNPDLNGLNVTIPYKSEVIPFLDELSPAAREIGAVNTIKFDGEKLIGFNTDVIGFRDSLRGVLGEREITQALVLGTGGASKGIVYALAHFFDCASQLVSRREGESLLNYQQLEDIDWESYDLVVNTTPLGTYPDVNTFPALPYERFHSGQIAFDLVYNPAETMFLKQAKAGGATIVNGYEMLVGQAEAAWEIWGRSLS